MKLVELIFVYWINNCDNKSSENLLYYRVWSNNVLSVPSFNHS